MSAVTSYLNRSFTIHAALAWLWQVLVLLVLGAHFYRADMYGLVLCVAGVLVFSCSTSRWKQYAVAFFLLWGMLEWGHSAYILARMRLDMGLPWMRAAAILLVVALLTGLSAQWAFARLRASSADNAAEGRARFQALVFMASFLALFFLRLASPMQFLLLERYIPQFGGVQIFFAAWYAAFVAGLLADPKHSRKFRRRIWLVFGLIFFAQFFLGLLGLDKMLLTGKLHVPVPAFIIFAPLFRESFSMMPIIVLVATVLAGSAWCSHLCYFGPFDGILSGNKAVAAPGPALSAALKYGRMGMLVAGALGAYALGRLGLDMRAIVSIAIVYAFVSLAIMAWFSRKQHAMVHCTTFCPMGLLVNWLGRLNPWRIRVDTQRCNACGACEKVCRYYAITPESRAQGKTLSRCSLCRDCLGVCGQKALFLRCPGLSASHSHALFVGIVSVLHGIFLNVAMV